MTNEELMAALNIASMQSDPMAQLLSTKDRNAFNASKYNLPGYSSEMSLNPAQSQPTASPVPPQQNPVSNNMLGGLLDMASNYQGLTPIEPILGTIQRGGGMMQAPHVPMVDYGSGIMGATSGSGGEKNDDILKMILKFIGG